MYTTNGRTITLKRGIAEWFNEDCPDIYDKDGNRVFHTDISQTYTDEKIKPVLYKFIKSSHDLFCVKYKYEKTLPFWINELSK